MNLIFFILLKLFGTYADADLNRSDLQRLKARDCTKGEIDPRWLSPDRAKPSSLKRTGYVETYRNRSHITPMKYSFMLKLKVYLTDRYGQTAIEHCGATLIHPKLALTASHCVSDGWYKAIALGGASHLKSEYLIERRVKKAYCHRDHRYHENDIAILELDEPFPGFFQIAEINSAPLTAPNLNNNAALSWPVYYEKKKEHLEDLLFLTRMKLVKSDYDSDDVFATQPLKKKRVSSKNYQSLCKGESGSPLFNLITQKLIGIFIGLDPDHASYLGPCTRPDYKMYFTDVHKYYSWITDLVEVISEEETPSK